MNSATSEGHPEQQVFGDHMMPMIAAGPSRSLGLGQPLGVHSPSGKFTDPSASHLGVPAFSSSGTVGHLTRWTALFRSTSL